MSGLEWLALAVCPPLLIVVTKYVLNIVRDKNQKQLERIEKLGVRLSEQLAVQSTNTDSSLSAKTSQKILQSLRDSQSELNALNRLRTSSIGPVEESAVLISEQLDNLDAQLAGEDNLATLSLASLAVIYVRSHITQMIRVEDMAQKLRASRVRLNSFLNQTLGCSAQALINVIKMQEAKKLLKEGDLLVKEVAFRVGYPNPYHFSVRFKLFFGVAPSVFQKHYQKRDDRKIIGHPPSISDLAEDQSCSPIDPVTEKNDHNQNSQIEEEGVNAPEVLAEGTKVDRFLIVDLIGRGGMGVVYKAYDPKLNRGVALKLIRADHAQSINSQTRLLREAQALARLSHPNVLPVYDVGNFGQQIFMTMALVEGQTLKDWLKSQHRTIDEILRVLIAAGQGLSAAHRAGLVHRDFKPGNVIVGNDGQVRVLDFGLARAADQVEEIEENPTESETAPETPDGRSQESKDPIGWKEISSASSPNLLQSPLTHEGGVLGTPLYMAPEQHFGLRTDERTDQFGFCVVLYEALYGRRPFLGASIEKLKSEVIRHQVCVPSADSEVPGWLWQIIRKGLSANPEHRYPTMDLLLEDLDKDPEEVRRQKRRVRRRNVVVVSLLIVTTALPIGVWYALRYRTFQLCKDTEGEFDNIWDVATKSSIRHAFLGSRKPYALGTWERIELSFNKYLADWKQMRSDICEARLIRGIESEELFDLRMSCLKTRKQELNALTKVFGKADAQVVQKAVQASSSLTSITICADEKALRASYPPPKTTEAKAKIAVIRDELSEVEALGKTGNYKEGLELAKKLETKSRAVDYKPVMAEVLLQLGNLLESAGEYKKAETTLQEAARMAGECQYGIIAAKAMVLLESVVGYRQGRPELGLYIAHETDVVLGLVGAEKIRGKHLNNLGVLFLVRGSYDKALEYYQEALVIREKLLGHEHPDVATSLNNIGCVYQYKGEYEKALVHYRQSLAIKEKALGHEHPNVAASLNNIGIVYQYQGKYEKALENYNKSLSIKKKVYGTKHHEFASSLNNIGVVFWRNQNYQKALAYFSRSLKIDKKILNPNHPSIANNLNNIGLILWKTGKFGKAVEHLQRALQIWEDVLGSDHPQLAWPLSGLGEVFQATGKLTEAYDKYTRVTKICRKATCYSEPAGMAYFGLSKIVYARDKERSISLAKQARKVFGKTPKAFKQEIEEITTWLQKHGVGKLAKKSLNDDPR